MAITINGNGSITGITTRLADAAGPAGSILQIVQDVKTDAWSGDTTFADITGLSQAITPSASSSKILVRYMVWMGSSAQTHKETLLQRDIGGAGYGNIQATAHGGTTYSYTGDSDEEHHSLPNYFEYLDSPNTTSAVTYKIQGRVGSGTAYVNRKHQVSTVLNTSYITLMEIAV
tara:strand:- start:1432 stop:1953 length:522 start_codon:yes stop_codon:yes gene_type:complete